MMNPDTSPPTAGPTRARSSAAKADRHASIIQAARALAGQTPFADLTMDAVAAHAQVTKGTLYLYFPTKEQLFLAVLQVELSAWFDAVNAELQRGGEWSAERVTALLTESFTTRPTFLKLLAILESVLERNITLDTAIAFKQALLARSVTTAQLLERRTPGLPTGEGLPVLLRIRALLVGLHVMTDPSPIVLQAFATEAALRPFQLTLATELQRGISALLRGAIFAS
jgi:AcrR family transcriptional regulator